MSKITRNRMSKTFSPKEIATLIEASHITADEIENLHANFLQNCTSGEFDKKTFIEYFKKLNPYELPDKDLEEAFDLIDANNSGTIDFHEFLVVVVLMHRIKNLKSRLEFAFNMWDQSDDGSIDQNEVENVLSAIYDRAGITNRKGERDPKRRAKEIIAKLDINGNKKLSKEEFINGCQNDPVIRSLLALD